MTGDVFGPEDATWPLPRELSVEERDNGAHHLLNRGSLTGHGPGEGARAGVGGFVEKLLDLFASAHRRSVSRRSA